MIARSIRPGRRGSTVALATLLLAALAGTARSDEVVAGVVLRTEARQLFINLGGSRGMVDGAQIRIKRPIKLRHPVTREPVVDWLPLGGATITTVSTSMSMAEVDADLREAIQVGDIVEVYVVRDDRPAAPVRPPPAADARPMPEVDPDTAEVLRLWRTLSGAPLDRRIGAWEGWLASHPTSPHAAMVQEDLTSLRAQRDAMSPQRRPGASLVAVAHSAPSQGPPGRDLPLVFVVDDPAALASASLHYRTRGAPTYHRQLLSREGSIYLRGAIPAAAMTAPGVEYFVETATAGGQSGTAFASPVAPHTVDVDPAPLITAFDPAPGRVRLSILVSYLDFAAFDRREGDRRDRFGLGEIDVLYRLRGPLWGIRVGFGSYAGEGGRANGLWSADVQPPSVGFQYGYVETELQTKRAPVPLGAAARLIPGVGNDGFALGVAGRVRIGDPDRTNLAAWVSRVGVLGFVSELRLETWPLARLPVGISVGVTDQPANGDLGVRLATELGWQARPWVRPTVRLSWQGRTTNHAGLGGGLGLVFDW
jgi:hypothetical protein